MHFQIRCHVSVFRMYGCCATNPECLYEEEWPLNVSVSKLNLGDVDVRQMSD